MRIINVQNASTASSVKIGANNAIQLDLIHNLPYKIIKIDIFLHFAVSNLDCVQIFNWYKLSSN